MLIQRSRVCEAGYRRERDLHVRRREESDRRGGAAGEPPRVQPADRADRLPGAPGPTLWQGVILNYGAASVASVHNVVDEIDYSFIAQAKTGTTIATSSHIGKNANISLTAAGNANTKQSGMAVDGATIAVTSALDLRILRVAMIVPNAEGDSAILEVVINKHALGLQTAGV